MAVISKNLNWVISANTSGFTRAVLASRSEATALKRVLAEVKNPLADWTEAEKRLTTILKDSTITEDQRTAAMARLNAQHPAAIAAARERANAEREAQQIMARNATAQERYAESVKRLAELKGQGLFAGDSGQRAYQAELGRLKETLPAIREKREAERAAAAEQARRVESIQREAAAVVARNRTERENYSDQVKRLVELRRSGAFQGNEQAYSRELARLKETLPAIRAKRDAEREAIQARLAAERAAAAADESRMASQKKWLTWGTTAVAASVGLMARRVLSGAGERVQDFREAQTSSRKIGVDVSEYLRLTEVARKLRVESSAVEAGIFKAGEKAGEAMMGMEEPRKILDSIGVSWQRLSQMAPVDQFLAINKAIQQQATASERAAAGQKIYGESVRDLAPILSLTRKELDAFATAKGNIYTDREIAALEAASEATRKNEEAWRKMTVAMAPTVEKIEKAKSMFWDFVASDRRVNDIVIRAQNPVQNPPKQSATKPPDSAKKVVDPFVAAQSQVAALAAQKKAAEEAAQAAKQLNTDWADLQRTLRAEEETIGLTSRQTEIYKLQLRGLTDGIAANLAAEARRIEALRLTHETTKELSKQIRTWQLSADAAKRYELSLQGLNKEQLAQIRFMQAVAAQQQAFTATQDKGTESWFKTWEAVRQSQLQAQQARTGRTGRDPKDQAAEETSELRRQFDVRKLIAQMQRDGNSPAEIQARVRLAEMNNEFDRQAEALGRRNKLFDEARQAAAGAMSPAQHYGEEIRKLEKWWQTGALSLEEYQRLQRSAFKDLAQGLPKPLSQIQGVRAGTADADAHVEELRRNERQMLKAAELAAAARKQVRAPAEAANARLQAQAAEKQAAEVRMADQAAWAERMNLASGDPGEESGWALQQLERRRAQEADPRNQQTNAARQFGRPGTQAAPGEERTAGYWTEQLKLQSKILAALQAIAGGERISLVETKP